MHRTILVTGAAGFIGSHVCEALSARGDVVIGLDNFDNYYDPARKRANLVEMAHRPDVLIEGDIRNLQLIERLFDAHAFDCVIHLAGVAGVRASVDNPHLYFAVNQGGTINLLEAARKRNGINFVFASTSSTYGSTTRIPFVETDACDRPLAPYPASKRAVEMLGYTYHHLHGLDFTALRFFTVYGPRNRPDMMIHKLATSCVYGHSVPLYNAGQIYRDWTYVKDVVSGIVAAADRPLGYEVINIGRGEPILLADLVRDMEEIIGRRATLLSKSAPSSDMPRTFADISKARELLGYEPNTSMRQGIELFWEWYQQAILREGAGRLTLRSKAPVGASGQRKKATATPPATVIATAALGSV